MTIRETARAQLKRIVRDAMRVPCVNAVLEVNPDALALADALDEKPASERGALFGMTVLLKDNIGTHDAMHTSAGALVLKDHIAAEDAFAVGRLRDADALILGKANMTELSNFLSSRMPDGFSARGGLVRNPHNLSQSASGSSSGCAAAVAAGFSSATVGTETQGSIIAPCQRCGVVGLKPTAGLVSRNGIIPVSRTLDTVGPIARSVRDAARLLKVMAGYDPADTATNPMGMRAVPNYPALLNPELLRGARIGVNRWMEPAGHYKPYSRRLLRFLAQSGAELIPFGPFEFQTAAYDIMHCEFKASLNGYLESAGRNAAVRSLADIAAFNLLAGEAAIPYGQDELLLALNETTGRMTEPEYARALDTRRGLMKVMADLFEMLDLDAIIEPAGYNNIAPLIGYPAGTVPIGRMENNVPVGCYLMGRPFEEPKLLSLLYAIECHFSAAGRQQ